MTNLNKKKKIESPRVLRTFLHKAYLELLESTFKFIKLYYIKNREINPKRDPEIYGSLVHECSLTELKKKKNFLLKLFLKLQQNEFYEDYFLCRELIQLLFLPCFNKMEYYILIQHHMLENGAILQIELQNYFNYTHSNFSNYIRCITKTYNIKNLLKTEYLNYNIRLVNQKTRNFTKNRPIKAKYQEIQAIKHQSLAIQLVLLKEISKAETKQKIKKLCYILTSFLFKPDELYCGYI